MSCISIDTERLLFRMNLCIVSIAFNGYTVIDRTSNLFNENYDGGTLVLRVTRY